MPECPKLKHTGVIEWQKNLTLLTNNKKLKMCKKISTICYPVNKNSRMTLSGTLMYTNYDTNFFNNKITEYHHIMWYN